MAGAIRYRRGWRDAAVVGLPLAALYGATVSPDLGTVDSGELATAGARLGIAHPTGYPLYTLLARLSVLSMPASPIAAVNLLSAACAVAAAVVTAWVAREFLSGRFRGETGAVLPWAAGLLLGTSGIFWSQATGNEVYSLHLLLVALLLWRGAALLRPESGPRDLWLLAWIGGLGAAHHLSVVFLAPAVLLCVVVHWRRYFGPREPAGGGRSGRLTARPFPVLAAAAAFAILAWSIVLYLPIRAAADPVLEWGAPDSWRRFWDHILGRQYRVWMFESAGQWAGRIGGYFASLPDRFLWPTLALVPLGAIALAGRTAGGNRAGAAAGEDGAADPPSAARWVLPLVFLVTVLWASSYDIHDLAPYFLPADLALAVFAVVGLGWLADRAFAAAGGGVGEARVPRGRSRATRWVPACVALALVAAQAIAQFAVADRRRDRFVRFHARAVLEGLPEGTVLFSRFWDALVSPSVYLQEIDGLRRDVAVIDLELLRRSWYYPQLARWDGALLPPLQDRVAAFLERVADFEAGRPYDAARIEQSFRAVIAGIATAHRPGRPTACTADAEPDLREIGVLVPEGLVYAIRDGPEEARVVDPPDVAGLLRSGYRPDDPIHRQVVLAWAHAIAARVRFLEVMGRGAELPPWREAMERIRPAAEKARARSR